MVTIQSRYGDGLQPLHRAGKQMPPNQIKPFEFCGFEKDKDDNLVPIIKDLKGIDPNSVLGERQYGQDDPPQHQGKPLETELLGFSKNASWRPAVCTGRAGKARDRGAKDSSLAAIRGMVPEPFRTSVTFVN